MLPKTTLNQIIDYEIIHSKYKEYHCLLKMDVDICTKRVNIILTSGISSGSILVTETNGCSSPSEALSASSLFLSSDSALKKINFYLQIKKIPFSTDSSFLSDDLDFFFFFFLSLRFRFSPSLSPLSESSSSDDASCFFFFFFSFLTKNQR